MRTFLIIVVLLLAGMYAFARYVRRVSMFYPSRYPEGAWDTRALPVQPEDQTFTTEDGVRLHAWLFRSPAANAPLMIWFHGNGGNITDRADIAATLAMRGVSVFLFDYRGYGKSEGSPSESGLFRDSIAAYDFAKTMSSEPPAIYGESLGGPYAAYVANRRPSRSVIIENSFPSLLELGNALYAPIPLGLTAPFALRTTHWLNAAGKPVLVMHGKADGVIPFRLGLELYEKLRVRKEMLVSERAGHCEIPNVEASRYYDAVVRWVKQ